MAGPRTQALQETPYLLVTVWPTLGHQENDGWALRYSSHPATVVDAKSRNLHYFPVLDPDKPVADALNTAPKVMSFSVPWSSDTLKPIDVDFRFAVGEVAILWTVGGVTGAWIDREVRVSGEARVVAWGNGLKDDITITIQDPDLVDVGHVIPPEYEIDSQQFPDVANTGDLDRAQYSEGLLPPRVFAPIGSAMLAPIYHLQDIVAAVSGVSNIGLMRYGVGFKRPASTQQFPVVTHQFRMLDPERDGNWMALATSSEYRSLILAGTDGIGRTYYYTQGDFPETIGTGDSDYVIGGDATLADIGSDTHGSLNVGDQIRDAAHSNDDYLPVASIDGTQVTFDGSYGGGTTTNATTDNIRASKPVGYPGFRICSLGGEAGPDGVTPVSNVIDVLIDILRDAKLPVPLALGDLLSMKPRLIGMDISTVINDTVSPWDWASGGPLSWLPIRPYRDGPRIRFAWVGPVDESEIETTINLDDLGPGYRMRPYTWRTKKVFPKVNMRYWWDIKRQSFTRSILQDGFRSRVTAPTSPWTNTGRAVRAAQDWRSTRDKCEELPTLSVDVPELEIRLAAGIASTWVMYDVASWRQGMVLDIAKPLFWMKPGTIARITETGGTKQSQVWRSEQRSMAPSGLGSIVFEGVPT